MEFDSFEELLNFIENYYSNSRGNCRDEKSVQEKKPAPEKKSVKIEDTNKVTDLDKQYSIRTVTITGGVKLLKIHILAPYLNRKTLSVTFKKYDDQYCLNVKWENLPDPTKDKDTVYCSFRVSEDGNLTINGFKKIDKKTCTVDYIDGIIEIMFKEMPAKNEDQFTLKLRNCS